MPHGKIILFPTITLTFAFVFSMITLMIPQGFVRVADEQSSSYSSYGAGFWPYGAYGPTITMSNQDEINQDDVDYADDYYPDYWYFPSDLHKNDPYRKAAMSFGLVASIVGMGTMIGLWPITCHAYNKTARRAILGLVLMTFISQICTFFMFGTEYCNVYDCKIGPGGGISIVASILWLVGLVAVAKIPDAKKNQEQQSVETRAIETAFVAEEGLAATVTKTTTTTQTIRADGSKVTETVVTHPDGSKTVERTVEEASALPSVEARAVEK